MRTLTPLLVIVLMTHPTAASLAREAVTLGTGGRLLTYVVLGDSTAAGVGGPYESGIAIATTAALARTRRVTMTNFAVSGARANDVLKNQVPRAELLRADLVLISVGANDVTHLTAIHSVRRDLRAIVQRLRLANPLTKIVITGSPDMGAPPRIPKLLRGLASRRTNSMNKMLKEIASTDGLVFAPIAEVTGPMFRRDRTLFANDRFHPNERGYATWIPVLSRALTDALSTEQ